MSRELNRLKAKRSAWIELRAQVEPARLEFRAAIQAAAKKHPISEVAEVACLSRQRVHQIVNGGA